MSLKTNFHKINIDTNHNNIKMKVKFISHCDEYFKKIREMDGITEADINASLDVELNQERIFKSGQGSGKSGSFFFFSFDSKFIIKTIVKPEMELLSKMMKTYVKHIESTDNKSLLARIYGLYTIVTNRFGSLDIMLMQNTSQLVDKANHTIKFDLKGSSVKRHVSLPPNESMFWKNCINQKVEMKDINLKQIN